MSNGTFEDFLDAMRAFESGWDSARYATGDIVDAQLNLWAGGVVSDFYPDLNSWGEMSAAQWDEMSYRSENTLGFVGYQFGEALMIDLGYYEADTFYGNGTATNTWEGTWTGKNGINSLEDFKTEAAQEIAIREAFGFNLQIIETGLANAGRSLDEFLGSTVTYVDQGVETSVTITMTGLLAAAHLRGAYGTLNLLLSDAVSFDENGTSILSYLQRFGGYDAPSAEEIVAAYTDSDTGGSSDTGSAGVTAETADVVLTWDYGADITVAGFDVATQTIFVGWISAADLEVSEEAGSTVFAIPANAQVLTLAGVPLAALSAENFTFLDDSAAQKVLALVGGTDPQDDADDQHDDTGGGDEDSGDTNGNDSDTPIGNGDAGVSKETADVVITWAYGTSEVIADFDPTTDTIFVDWIPAEALSVTETAEGVIFSIPSNAQTTTLSGTKLAELSPANFTILDATAATEILSLIGEESDTGHGDDQHGGGDGMGHMHMHVVLNLASDAQTITGFMPTQGDVIEIEGDIYAESFSIFEESGDALGQTVRIEITDGGMTRQIVFTGFGLDDLDIGNFSIANEGVLNEVAAALGSVVVAPGDGDVPSPDYDTDGSNPFETTGTTALGGTRFKADSNADDITGFDTAVDALDFGGTSVHGMIVTKSETGEIVIDSPWSDAAQIVQGITYQDVTLGNFGVVGNEHFRQDMGGVISWEQGIGPRESDTVYVRSHEYGVHEVIDGFDPGTMKISFLYFGTRERLLVEDSAEGLVISSLPTGQSLTLTGVALGDLVPGRLEFHHDQVMEDNLEDAFGFAQDDVSLVSRAELLTPQAPAGATTDGTQVREGKMTLDDTGNPDAGGEDPAEPAEDVIEITWDWGVQSVISDFDSGTDSFDFGALTAAQLDIREEGADFVIEVLNNGGHSYIVQGIQAEDLSEKNFAADTNNTLLADDSAFFTMLGPLGYDLD